MDNKLINRQECIFEKTKFFPKLVVRSEIPAYKKLSFTDSGYNYWKHILKEELASQVLPDIVPVSLPEIQTQTLSVPASNSCLANRPIRATAKLTINDVSVEFDSDISEEFLCTILKAVRYA